MKSRRCIFCEIVAGQLPAETVFQSEMVIAVKDIRPQAPVHILIIPKEHIPTLNDLTTEHRQLIGEMFLAARNVAAEFGLSEKGYRTVLNCNKDAGQQVYHIHLHVLGGRKLGWPPG